MLATLLAQVLAYYTALVFHNNLVVMHLFSILTVPLYAGVFLYYFQYRITRILVLSLFTIALLLCSYISFFFERFTTFPSLNLHVLSFAVIISSMLCFRQMMNAPVNLMITSRSEFWLVVAMFFYYTTTLSLWTIFNKLIGHENSTVIINQANYFLSLIYYSVIAASFVLEIRTQKSTR